MSEAPRTLLVLAGPTATGKSDLGEQLALALGGEVVCADARQVFGELEAGTGKPSPAERAALPHHLFEALSLEDRPSAGWYARAARETCEAVFARGRVPVLVGGSGLYLRALLEGLQEEPPHDAAVRARLRARLQAEGPERLHEQLAGVDAPTAARLAPRDGQRITRALEVHEVSGRPLSWWHANAPRQALSADARVLKLECPAAGLDERIARRSRAMFEGGLVEEVRALASAGRAPALRALHAIGYDEALDFLEGASSIDESVRVTSLRTRQLAKRQRTWFRHQLDGQGLAARARWGPEEVAEALAAARLTPRP